MRCPFRFLFYFSANKYFNISFLIFTGTTFKGACVINDVRSVHSSAPPAMSQGPGRRGCLLLTLLPSLKSCVPATRMENVGTCFDSEGVTTLWHKPPRSHVFRRETLRHKPKLNDTHTVPEKNKSQSTFSQLPLINASGVSLKHLLYSESGDLTCLHMPWQENVPAPLRVVLGRASREFCLHARKKRKSDVQRLQRTSLCPTADISLTTLNCLRLSSEAPGDAPDVYAAELQL